MIPRFKGFLGNLGRLGTKFQKTEAATILAKIKCTDRSIIFYGIGKENRKAYRSYESWKRKVLKSRQDQKKI